MPRRNAEDKGSRVLFSYRVTPHATTGLSPAELLLSCMLRCMLDSIHPDFEEKVKKQARKPEN